MYGIVIAIFAFFVLFCYELRYRSHGEDLETLKELVSALREDVAKLKAEINMKQDVYKQFEGPKRQE